MKGGAPETNPWPSRQRNRFGDQFLIYNYVVAYTSLCLTHPDSTPTSKLNMESETQSKYFHRCILRVVSLRAKEHVSLNIIFWNVCAIRDCAGRMCGIIIRRSFRTRNCAYICWCILCFVINWEELCWINRILGVDFVVRVIFKHTVFYHFCNFNIWLNACSRTRHLPQCWWYTCRL